MRKAILALTVLVSVLVTTIQADQVSDIKRSYATKIEWAKKHPFDYSTPVSVRIKNLVRKRDREIASIRSKKAKVRNKIKRHISSTSKVKELQQQVKNLQTKLINLDIKLIKKIKKTNIQEFGRFHNLCSSFDNVKIREVGEFLECYIDKNTYLKVLEQKLSEQSKKPTSNIRDANRSKDS